MLNSIKHFVFVSLALGMSVPVSAQTEVTSFLDQFCTHCHGEKKPKAELSLHKLSPNPVTRAEIATWKEVFSKIENREMPPAGAKQPAANVQQKILASIGDILKSAGESIDESRWLAPSRGNWIDHDAFRRLKTPIPLCSRERHRRAP